MFNFGLFSTHLPYIVIGAFALLSMMHSLFKADDVQKGIAFPGTITISSDHEFPHHLEASDFLDFDWNDDSLYPFMKSWHIVASHELLFFIADPSPPDTYFFSAGFARPPPAVSIRFFLVVV